MKLALYNSSNPRNEFDGREYELSTEAATSSYGLPILLIDGEAYSPSESIPANNNKADILGWIQEPAHVVVREWAERNGFIDTAHEYHSDDLGVCRTKADTPRIIRMFLANI